MTTKNFSTIISAGVVAATLSVAAQPADAFIITNTSGSWDNVTLADGYVIGSDGHAAADWNAVEFIDSGNDSQVRWGDALYGTEVTTTSVWDWNSHDYDDDYGWYTNAYGQEKYGWYNYETTTETVYTADNKSGLGYEGVSNLNLGVGEIFNIGTLTHFNQTIEGNYNVGQSAEFSLDLDFGNSSIGNQSFDFTFHVDETDNDAAVCPYNTIGNGGCSDQITWNFDIEQQNSFIYEDEEYTLELVGFADSLSTSGALNANDIVNDFISQEKADNSAGLFARIVKVDTTEEIPEPAALLGLAGFGLYFASSRKKKAAELAA